MLSRVSPGAHAKLRTVCVFVSRFVVGAPLEVCFAVKCFIGIGNHRRKTNERPATWYLTYTPLMQATKKPEANGLLLGRNPVALPPLHTDCHNQTHVLPMHTIQNEPAVTSSTLFCRKPADYACYVCNDRRSSYVTIAHIGGIAQGCALQKKILAQGSGISLRSGLSHLSPKQKAVKNDVKSQTNKEQMTTDCGFCACRLGR